MLGGFKDHGIIDTLERDIYPVLSDKILFKFKSLNTSSLYGVEEIRLRADKPLIVSKGGKDYFISEDGNIDTSIKNPFLISKIDIEKSMQLMSNYSIYSIEEELKQGFLTLRGGHRVGMSGRCVIEGKNVKTIKNISGMNIRIAREVKGCSTVLIDNLFALGIGHTLIASSPGCGKTTMLRDMIRILSDGDNILQHGFRVGVVDERSEIAGCYLGVPQRDVGIRTDVLDACPKVQGMGMLLRAMSPEIIAVDEIGSIEDANIIETAINSGVKVIATVHGQDMKDIEKRPGIKALMNKKCFEKIVFLNRKNGPGTIEKIISLS